jgi:hypothetical protein
MLERPPPAARRQGAAQRQARSRARRRRGRILLKVEVDEHELIGTLMLAGKLDEVDGLERARVEQALGHLVADWIERWKSGDVTRGLLD